MQYRPFGRTGVSPSVLGFGMMRMPKNEDGSFDEKWTIDTLRYAIDNGLTYVDTAYAYGESERITGLALRDGYREKVCLATKIPVVRMEEESDFEKILEEELSRLQTDHIDMYLLHAMNRATWEDKVQRFHVLEHAEKARAAGKIRYLGFSFHDDLDAFLTILNGYDKWDFCQIQLNYMDVNYQAGLKGLEAAHEKGLAVVIMEPLRGGTLANVPEEVAAMLPGKPVESALNFLWDRKEVNVVLSGMNDLRQVQENLALADQAHIGMLTGDQRNQMLEAGNKMRKGLSIPCTACNYCNVCPNDIPIPKIFGIRNRLQIDGGRRKARERYAALGEVNASKCICCAACVKYCPQHIDIPSHLAKIHEMLK